MEKKRKTAPTGRTIEQITHPNGEIRITVGIKNSYPLTTNTGRWVSISPSIAASVVLPPANESDQQAKERILEAVQALTEAMLPSYGLLVLNEAARVAAVDNGSLIGMASDLLGLSNAAEQE